MQQRALAFFSFINNPFVVTSILFILQLGLFLWTTLRPFSISPPNRTYLILRGQLGYTSFIRQSKEGAWKLYNPNTTRPSPPVAVHLFYVFLGKIAQVFAVDPPLMYMTARVVGGAILFLATYWLISLLLPVNLRTIAVLFCLGLEPGPTLTAIRSLSSITSVPPAIFSYYTQIVAYRHFGLPHHVMAEAVGLLLLGNVFLFVKKSSWWRLTIIALLTLAGTIIMPAYNSVLVITLFAAWLVWAIVKGDKRVIPAIATIAICIALVAVFTKSQMDLGYPWKNFNLDEKGWVTDMDVLVSYLSSLLLYLPPAVALWIMLPSVWRKTGALTKLLVILLTTWAVGPLLYIPLTHLDIFPFANFRLVDGYAYVPMGILAALGVHMMSERAKTAQGKRWVLGVGVGIMLMLSASLTVVYTRQTFAEQKTIWSNVYPLNQEWDAIRFLSTVPNRSGVMVTKYLGEIIPEYAHVRVFLGATPGMVDWGERYYEAVNFYSGKLSDTDATSILTREDISYVWWGADEKALSQTPSLYPDLLTPVFQNPAVTIFKIQP